MDENNLLQRLEAATSLLEEAVSRLEQRQECEQVERIAAMVEPSPREAEMEARLRSAEQQLEKLRASTSASVLTPLRRTLPGTTTEMLAKYGIGDGPVDVRKLDAALVGLSLEQRIAVKTQLLRAGSIA